MAGEDIIQRSGIKHAGFDELEHAAEVLGAPHGQGDGNKVFRRRDAEGNSLDLSFAGTGDGFLLQGTGGRQELNRPIANVNILALGTVTQRQEVIIERPLG